MGKQVLIDSNIAIGYIGGSFESKVLDLIDSYIDEGYHMSVINQIEILGYPKLLPEDEEKFKMLISYAELHHIDNKVIKSTIEIRKMYRLKLPDAIIAATCLIHDLCLITRNTKDFGNIEGLVIIDPSKLSGSSSR